MEEGSPHFDCAEVEHVVAARQRRRCGRERELGPARLCLRGRGKGGCYSCCCWAESWSIGRRCLGYRQTSHAYVKSRLHGGGQQLRESRMMCPHSTCWPSIPQEQKPPTQHCWGTAVTGLPGSRAMALSAAETRVHHYLPGLVRNRKMSPLVSIRRRSALEDVVAGRRWTRRRGWRRTGCWRPSSALKRPLLPIKDAIFGGRFDGGSGTKSAQWRPCQLIACFGGRPWC